MKKVNHIEIFSATPDEVNKAITGKTCKWCLELGRKIHKKNDHVCGRCENVRNAYAKSLKGEVKIVYKLF